MNNTRRAKLTKARGLIEQAKEIIAQAASEEREYFDKLPEIVLGDRAERAAADAASLDKAYDSLEEVLTALDVISVDVIDEVERFFRPPKDKF